MSENITHGRLTDLMSPGERADWDEGVGDLNRFAVADHMARRLRAELTRLRDALPKCWRLDEEGKRVQDVAVVLEMEVWLHVGACSFPGGREPETTYKATVKTIGKWVRVLLDCGARRDVLGCEFSNSREAAEAARSGD